MDRYEVMAGKMAPLTDGAHRKWGFAGKSGFSQGLQRAWQRIGNLSRTVGSGSRLGKSGAIGARTAQSGYLP